MRNSAILLLLLAACDEPDTRWLRDSAWDDGQAVVSVFRGRLLRYGTWRDAEVRDYLVREYLHPTELTKRDQPTPDCIPVLKANRQVTFTTGMYDYRLMHSLFFERATGRLVKGIGTSQEGCGIVVQRWDARARRLLYDSYWEGEGAGGADLSKQGLSFFADEIPFLGAMLEDKARIVRYPSLLRNRVGTVRATSLEKGVCTDCAPTAALEFPAENLTVAREGRICRLLDAAGGRVAEYAYDAEGFLERWEIPGQQEFRRVSRTRIYYWDHTADGDEKRLRGE